MNIPKYCVMGVLLSFSVCVQVNATEPPPYQGKTQTLITKEGKSFQVYTVGSKSAARGILLIHGWLGLHKGIKSHADQYANAGYRAMAIDLFNGKTADNPKDAKALVVSTQQSESTPKLATALSALNVSKRNVAVLGWSWGGAQVLHATLAAPDKVSAAVAYYPSFREMVTDTAILGKLKSPMLIEVGDQDFAFTTEKRTVLQSAMDAAGQDLTINVYTSAKHGFNQTKGKNYSPEAHALAKASTQAFLNRHLADD